MGPTVSNRARTLSPWSGNRAAGAVSAKLKYHHHGRRRYAELLSRRRTLRAFSALAAVCVAPVGNAPWLGLDANLCRRRSRQPANRGVADAKGPRDVCERLAGVAASNRLAPLMRRQLARPAHVHACGFRPGPTFTGAGLDQLALKLRQAA